MLAKILSKILGTKNERELKRLWLKVAEINEVWEKLKDLPDTELPKKTEDFIARIQDGESLDDILPEAFALVKETCRRLCGKKWLVCGIETIWNMVPFDVQLIGAIVLHEGKIAEMKTGEGKTLVATMPLYLNALTKRGVHLVTVNDYLARRDREWMGPIYETLGLTVGCIQQGMEPTERKPHYNADITYGTNNEFGFDYLRDNMVIRWEDKVQRGHYYAIVDEVDSILIDEARTPLIISGPVEASDRGFDNLTPLVKRGYQSQTILVNRLVEEGEKLLREGKAYEAGIKFLQARRGSPKNKRLMKVEQEEGVKKLIEKVELDFIRDKKLHELDAELLFVVDEKNHTIDLTEKGRNFLAPNDPEFFTLPDLSSEIAKIDRNEKLTPKERIYEKEKAYERYAKKSEILHNFQALLKAYTLFERDVDYIVQDNKVIIVDEFTGRLMPGRRFSDGLHQALEAKEGVRVQEETQTLATITIQNYFRMYEKLAGMTGTAVTQASEFWSTYKLDVIEIPTNEPVRRIDYPDVIYKTRREKYNAVLDEIEKWHRQGRPILVGTTSVEASETLSRMLRRRGINHQVLNAKYHQKEAEIVALAGQPGAVTIATNMAGRGTDIKLGKGVVKGEGCYITKHTGGRCQIWEENGPCIDEVPCGLYIIGTERHEARRIDNQLRGRSGRQGDPGSTRFFLSLEDDLMRLFGSDRLANIMDRFGVKEMEPIQHPLVSRAIENAQKRVEARNFEIRKHLLEYDDVMNRQREVIYHLRDQILKGENLFEIYSAAVDDVVDRIIEKYATDKYPENWDWDSIKGEFGIIFLADFTIDKKEIPLIKAKDLSESLKKIAREQYLQREAELGKEIFSELVKAVFLRIIDHKWRDHLYDLDILREGIGLVAYGQKDPLIEYKQESFQMFNQMMADFNKEAISLLFRAQVQTTESRSDRARRPSQPLRAYKPTVITAVGGQPTSADVSPHTASQSTSNKKETPVQTWSHRSEKIGRNEPCPCGSGKKYKKCCGKNQY
ncbi:MAG: preprotein translocase subunit SecA [candidate division WOR-3 bacterium]|nr:preprotein translocase subunit SecA [candidate division WOR-3 bacterium]